MSTRASDAASLPEDDSPRMTKRLDDLEPRSRATEIIEPRMRGNDGRIRELINALGDPNHPQHVQAVSDLVAIGPAAVPALGAALSPDWPWLTSYRAAEAIAQIGDGRASGSLINALRHPNSNVRWSVVRALAEVGDTRTLWALRRVAHEDRGKTSWGESVADTAQLALDRLQSRSALLRFSEPVKTALVFVAMFAAILFAADRVQAVMAELRRDVPVPSMVFSPESATPEAGGSQAGGAAADGTQVAAAPAPTVNPTPTVVAPTPTPTGITGTVRPSSANVRSSPSVGDNKIGVVWEGDEVVFLEKKGDWYRIRLGAKKSDRSNIGGNGEGWVYRDIVTEPSQPVPTAP